MAATTATARQTTTELAEDSKIITGTVTDFCDFRCMYAAGPYCDCSVCNGWNHGVLHNG